jgi:hypothetical protein
MIYIIDNGADYDGHMIHFVHTCTRKEVVEAVISLITHGSLLYPSVAIIAESSSIHWDKDDKSISLQQFANHYDYCMWSEEADEFFSTLPADIAEEVSTYR